MEALESHRVEPPPPLAGALLFFLPHPLPQLLADVGQRVHFGREGLYRVAKPAVLGFPAAEANKGESDFTAQRDGTAKQRREYEKRLTGVCVSGTVSSD